MTDNLEKIQTAQAPSPVVQTTNAKVETVAAPVVIPPTESPAEKQDAKVTAAFIKQRQENRELKEKLAKANAVNPPTPAAVVEPQAQPVQNVVPTAPAQNTAVSSIEIEGKQAIEALAVDKDLKAVTGAVVEILDMVDNDPRLARIFNIDPTIALREAKGMFLAKAGIAPTPTMPLSTSTSGGMIGGKTDLQALLKEVEKYQPGTKEFTQLAKKITAEMNGPRT